MRFSAAVAFLVTALADVAFGQDCGATATSCPTVREDAASRSSCSSYFTQNGISTSTCYTSTVTTTKYNLTRTETATFYETIDTTYTSISTIVEQLDASTLTTVPTTTTTVPATAYTTVTTDVSTYETTVTSYSTSVVLKTQTSTVTGYPPSTVTVDTAPSSTFIKLRKRQAYIPADCSCFLFTSTVRTRAAYEFPTDTTTITISTTILQVNSAEVTTSTTVTESGGVITKTEWTTLTVTSTNTLPKTSITETTKTLTQSETKTTTEFEIEYTYVAPNVPDTTGCANNAGVEVAIYDNPYRIALGAEIPADYDTFNPEYFKTSQPYGQNRTSMIGVQYHETDPDGLNYRPYGMTAKVTTYTGTNPNGAEYVINHRGYFFAPKTDTYTFRLFDTNDGAWLWVGQFAYTDWTRQNANAQSTLAEADNSKNTYTIELAEGSYTPFRILFGNAQNFGYFGFEIKDSSGEKFASYGTESPYLVAFACDRPLEAPPFADFGAETTTPTGPPDSTCNNDGVEVAIFTNAYLTDVGGRGYPGFVPETYKWRSPTGQKVSTAIGFDWYITDLGTWYPYGFSPPDPSTEISSRTHVIMWRGYFYVPKSGKYTIAVTNGDNFAAFWTGETAKSGWNRANAEGISTWYSVSGNTGYDQTTPEVLTLIGGTYLPIRVIIANSGGGTRIAFNIWDQDNNYYLKSSVATPYLVRSSCDGKVRRFSNPFGEED
ncbi:hypothetical protein TWF481_011524 [Arthrobotrys musiformis]|uniref:PA14 domain-containing protein n=1 Tax=Arthrobotrys musiformis TaxID=47236 RepID=A0AAV9VYP7_9PEZI